MKREAEINQAVNTYISTYFSPHIEDIEEAFRDGIEWADKHPKNIWHSIDDVPTGNYDIICKDKTNYWACSWEYFYENYPNWKQFVKEMNVEKWLYMHEL